MVDLANTSNLIAFVMVKVIFGLWASWRVENALKKTVHDEALCQIEFNFENCTLCTDYTKPHECYI